MRKPLPDLLKGLAIMLMIQVHIMELFALESIYASWAGRISLFLGASPAAPVFMVVMGYFLGLSKKSTGQKALRGAKLIGLGLLLNIGLNLHLLYKIIIGDFDMNPWEYIFGVDILFLAGISFMIIAVIGKLFRRNIMLVIALILGITGLSYIPGDHTVDHGTLKYLLALFWGDYNWSYFPVIPWLAYPLTGYLLAIMAGMVQESNMQIKTRLIVTFFTILIMVFSFKWAFSISTDLSLYYHHGTIFYLWTILFLILWYILNDLLIRYLNQTLIIKYLRWAGRHVTTFYVVQWLLIGNIATAIYKTQNAFQLILWFAGILFASSILVIIWDWWQKSRKNTVRF